MDRCQAQSLDEEVAIARRALGEGDPKHALHHLAAALAADPNRAEWLALLDQALDAGKNSPDLTPVLGPEPPYFGTVALHAYTLARTGRAAEAIDLILQIIHSYPHIPYIDWALRWLHRPEAAGRLPIERVTWFLSSMVQQYPALRNQRDGGRATLDRLPDFIRKVRATQPENADFLAISVSVLRRLGCLDEALEYARRSFALKPGFHSAVAVAVAHESRREPDDALQAYREALRFEPDDVSARLSMGDLLWEYDRTEEAEQAYAEALRIDPNQPWALPSHMYLRWLHTGDEGSRFQLLALADLYPDNQRARQMAGLATPYFGYLPEPSDATTNVFKNMLAQHQKIQRITRHTLTSLEAPSNYLAVPDLYQTEVAVVRMQRPDPRLPRKAVEHLLWQYDGHTPRVAVPPPDPEVVEGIAELARQRYHLPAWLRQAARLGPQLGPGRVRDVLATMVHPPLLDRAKRPWAWVYRVQVAAALVLSQLESGWENSVRRTALVSLVWGPMDWTVDAALVALAAVAAEEEGTADDVAGLFRELLANLPEGGPSCYYPALLWSMLRLPNLAAEERTALRKQLRAWYEVDTDEADTQLQVAQIHERNHDHAEAVKALTRALEMRPDFFEALEMRGSLRIHFEPNSLPEALADLTRALHLRPDSAYAHLYRGEALRRLGRYDEALRDFDEAIRLQPKAPVAFLWRGSTHEGKRDMARALADYDHALSLKEDAQGYFYRGCCLRAAGRLDEAIADLSKCLQLDPKFPSAYAERAWAHRSRGDRGRAVEDFSAALALRPSAFLFNERAATHYRGGNFAQAIADHAEAYRLGPDNPLTCNGLAWILATCPVDSLRDGRRALELAGKACELSRWQDSGYIDTLACAWAECGRFEEAVRYGEKVVEMVPPEEREEYEQRLALYRAGKAFRTG
jgi:tetratricopeptide (TPR) repeat protein